MDKLLSNKWVLIGGAGLMALGAFLYLRGGSSGNTATADDSNIWGTPSLMYAGGYGAATGAGLSGEGTQSSTDNATSMLLTLENKKVDIQRELGLGQIASDEKLGLATLQTQKDVSFRQSQSADFASAAEIFSNTIGKVKGKAIPAVLQSGVGLALNMGGVQSTINLGSGTGNPVPKTT